MDHKTRLVLSLVLAGLWGTCVAAQGPGGRGMAAGDGTRQAHARRLEADARWKADVRDALRSGRVRLDAAGMPRSTARVSRGFASRAPALEGFTYFPTADETDARFLNVPGPGLSTLPEADTVIELAAPSSLGVGGTLHLGIFDGDTGGAWDLGGIQSVYTLFADPLGDGSGVLVVGTWNGASMPDNDWFSIQIQVGPEAQSESGHFFYTLRVQNPNLDTSSSNAFKIRTSGVVSIKPGPFGILAPRISTQSPENAIIYPQWPALTPTTYDGTFVFNLDVPGHITQLDVWDGDWDFGSYDGSTADTDDPDTEGLVVPPWAAPLTTMTEGVNPANPNDDSPFASFRRSPSVRYEVVDPDGNRYMNNNPSGNQEWERFRLSTAPFNPTQMDYHAPELPPGTYRMEVSGLDLSNLIAFRFQYDLCGVDGNNLCPAPLRPYTIGDTVFVDTNMNGVQDAGEAGIAGVAVQLLSSAGNLIETTVTDADGHYSFDVAGRRTVRDLFGNEQLVLSGEYMVAVAGSNFAGGGPLVGRFSTTGGDAQTRSVFNAVQQANENNLNFDFGYAGPLTLGDRVWHDLNGDGLQGDPLVEVGIPGVQLSLLNDQGQVVSTAVTAADGSYSFGVSPGTYTVRVDAGNFNVGGALFNLASTTGGEQQQRVLTTTSVLSADFGYRAGGPAQTLGTVRGFVWDDLDRDGIQDPGEPGVSGVSVRLLNALGNPVGLPVTTDLNGEYAFTGLSPGTYSVRFTLPDGYRATAQDQGADDTIDSDAGATGRTASFTLAAGQAVRQDAGIVAQATLGGYVFTDTNGNGIQNGGEPPRAGVPVALLDGSGSPVLDSGGSPITAVTDVNGLYLFSGLEPGSYRVQFTAPSGFVFTLQDQGGDDTLDSDADASGRTAAVNLAGGDNRRSVDAGLVPGGSISGELFCDENENGQRDAGEPPLANVSVTLAGPVSGTTTTNAAGGYQFLGLLPGSYTVSVPSTVNGLAVSGQASVSVSLAVGGDAVQSFAYIGGAIIGYTYCDSNGNGRRDKGEAALSGVTITLTDQSGGTQTLVTDSSGFYCFFGCLPGGNYTVSAPASFQGRPLVTAQELPVTLAAGQRLEGNDFGYDCSGGKKRYQTQTQGGWGSKPRGNNAGAFLAANFSSIFPKGITIGGKYTYRFTSAKAVEVFLPQKSTPAALTRSLTNPRGEHTVFAGQVLALQINVAFSNAGLTRTGLDKLRVTRGPAAGWTVSRVLTVANRVLGGGSIPSKFTISSLNDVCAAINENFVDGKTDRGYLR